MATVTQIENMANCEKTSDIFAMRNNWPAIRLHMPTPLSHMTAVVSFIRTSKIPSKNSLTNFPLLPIVFETDPNRMQKVTKPKVLGPDRGARLREMIRLELDFDV